MSPLSAERILNIENDTAVLSTLTLTAMQLVQEAQLKQAIEHLGYGAVIDAMDAAFVAYSKGKHSSPHHPH